MQWKLDTSQNVWIEGWLLREKQFLLKYPRALRYSLLGTYEHASLIQYDRLWSQILHIPSSFILTSFIWYSSEKIQLAKQELLLFSPPPNSQMFAVTHVFSFLLFRESTTYWVICATPLLPSSQILLSWSYLPVYKYTVPSLNNKPKPKNQTPFTSHLPHSN